MSSPFSIVFYKDDDIVGSGYGNHSWISPNDLQKAKNIIAVVEGTSWQLGPHEKEWTHFIAAGRAFYAQDYEKMKQIVYLIESFDLSDFSLSYSEIVRKL
ncbi:hypothetical protein KNT91_gp164 [Aeromonas phage 60AhydR15PP]|uniref:Uncharacterized protein n=1 Tax=Aeromonas phage 60AhydR15PP TaxID=2163979 RepID=A0A2S1PGJ5_9CAUD|nr:hypothetical protein KNT91_gp164 [Aeromonas phage 60AhydR15PP]AWH15688.1 hypothetical protein [Aeromonas phage 60AhydR15PP]